MGCRFPGEVNNPDQYWQLLLEARSGIVPVPAQRWNADAYYSDDPAEPGTICTRDGGFLTQWGPDEFDAEFFGISPREAAAMDPQQRLVLEVAWEALEHAGIPPRAVRDTHTGVFVGLTANDYMSGYISKLRPEEIDAYVPFGNAPNFAAGRLAYLLGARGPAVAIDTACSSSLVAVHLACQSLRRRESDTALAAGVNLMLGPESTIALSRWGMLSPDGRCKTFDAGANGYVRSEGCGVVVLRRLSDALREGNRVLALVRGSAVNQDGASSGLTVPNGPAQKALLRQALASSRLQPADIDYVEAHGTATSLGDPIELEALRQVFSDPQRLMPVVLGSAKTNIGHLESGAGIAGLIKTVLSVGHAFIPKHLNFQKLTPLAAHGASDFVIAEQALPWPATGRPRRAGVSSFGVSGTNAHVVIEQAPEPDPVPVAPTGAPTSTLVVSGKTPERIASLADALADWMSGPGAGVALADVAHTLSRHRGRHPKFATVCARDHRQAVAGLRALAAGGSAPGVVATHDGPCGPGTVFVYSGQGSQWAGMARQLLTDEPAFANAIDEIEPLFAAAVGFPLRQVLAEGELVCGDARVQPVLMGLQLGLTALWRSYGVEPDAVIGHSMGEVAAAVVAGALTVSQGLQVIAARSRLMSQLAGQGAVALLELDAQATTDLITRHPEVSLAVYASPTQTVIAGPPAHIDELIATVQQQNRFAHRVNMEVASHNPIMDSILPELRAALDDLTPTTPTIPIFATANDDPTTTPVFDADYWVANIRNPVRFHQAITHAGIDHHTFIEISPHPMMAHAISQTIESFQASRTFRVTPTINRTDDQTLFFHSQLADVGASSAGTGRFVDIPTTPWHRSRFWVPDRSDAWMPNDAHPLLGMHTEMPSGDHVWQADVGTDVLPWLGDYRVHGQPMMPASAFAEIAIAATREALGQPARAIEVRGLAVEQGLPLERHTRITTQLIRGSDDERRVEVHSRSPVGDWCRHAVAHIAQVDSLETPESLGVSEFEITVPDEAPRYHGFVIHPVVLEAALQRLAAAIPNGDATPADTYVPVSFRSMRLFGEVGRRAQCHAEIVGPDESGDGRLGKVTLTDDLGQPTAVITGICVRPMERERLPLPLAQKLFEPTWVEDRCRVEPGLSITAAPGSWLILGDGADGSATADDFADRWRSPARRVVTVKLTDESAVLTAFAETAADPDRPPVGVIVFVDSDAFTDSSATTGLAVSVERARSSIWSLSAAVRAVVGGWHGRAPRLWLLTRRGLVVGDGESGDPAIGALRGLIRVLAYEHPELAATLIDLDVDTDPISAIRVELAASEFNDVIAWRAHHRLVERLSRVSLVAARRDPVVRPDASYIVTGGLGGLGLVVARWLADRGAGRIVLNGRSHPSTDQLEAVAELEGRCEVATVQGDIAEPEVAQGLVRTAEATGRQLRGVLHLAAVIDDSLLITMSRESLERSWAPKATGALRLHEATEGRALDWWLGFSSVSSLLGSPGQAAYACANAWLDAFVSWRSASGLPAAAINWGPWSEVGAARSLNHTAVDQIGLAEGIEALEYLLASGRVHTGVTRLRPDRALAAFPEIGALGYFGEVVGEMRTAGDDTAWPGPDGLRELDPVDAERIITERLCSRVAAIMGHTRPSAVDLTVPLIEVGIDSLTAVRIRNAARVDFGTEPPVALLLQGATLHDVATDLVGRLGLAGPLTTERGESVRDRANQRAAARRNGALRQKRGQRL